MHEPFLLKFSPLFRQIIIASLRYISRRCQLIDSQLLSSAFVFFALQISFIGWPPDVTYFLHFQPPFSFI